MENDLFLDLPNGQQKEILSNFKNMLKITWLEMATILKVNRSMVFFYCNDTCKMPFKHIKKLCRITDSNIQNFTSLNMKHMPHCTGKIIREPNHGEDLAEFIGVLSGDGCIVKSTYYSTYITCDAILDSNYVLSEVCPMFERLFNTSPKVRVQNGAIHSYVYSKNLFNFLSKSCLFPIGKKKNKLNIPSWISRRKDYSIAFLRGLFDTDGGFHKHHENSAQIGYTSYSPSFLRQIYELLYKLNFNPRLGKEDIWIFEKETISNFFEVIKPRNSKHLFKYKKFRETGKVPLSRDLKCGRRDLNPSCNLIAKNLQ